jgi:hypothetical protein
VRRRALTVVVLLAGTGLLRAAGAEPGAPELWKQDREQGRKLYDARYGEQRKAADKTKDKNDDVALASEYMADLARFPDEPALRLVLCEQAFVLAMRHSDGHTMAVVAAEMLLREFPEMREQHLPKAVRAYSARAKAGTSTATTRDRRIELSVDYASTLAAMGRFDEAFKVSATAATAADAEKSPRREEMLALRRYYQTRRDLKKRPDDLKFRYAAILMAIRELDAPTEAARMLVKELDEEFYPYVPLAAQPREDLGEAACLTLGDWYVTLSEDASAWGKQVCLTRARAYLARFLALHEAEDDVRLKAKLLLDKAGEQLDIARAASTPGGVPVAPPKTPQSKWVDLVQAADLTKCVVAGKWMREGDRLSSLAPAVVGDTRGAPRIAIPIDSTGSYELRAEFKRTQGAGLVGLILPVGQSQVRVTFGSTGKYCGLDLLDGRSCAPKGTAANPTSHVVNLSNDNSYRVRAAVHVEGSLAEIHVDLDGKEVIRWAGKPSSLSLPSDSRMPALLRVGLIARSPAVFRNVQLHMGSPESFPPNPAGNAAPKPIVTSEARSLLAKKVWPFSTEIKKGQTIQITASGSWRVQPGGKKCGPDHRQYCFRGRIGNGNPFKVGSKYTLYVKEDSVLYLGIKDAKGKFSNNSGQVHVKVTTTEFAPGGGIAVAEILQPKTGEGKWIDLLELVDPGKHRVAGKVERLPDGALGIRHLAKETPRVVIPVDLSGSYEFEAKFVRESGSETVAFILPTGRTAVRLTLSGYGGKVHGLSMISGQDSIGNETAVRPGPLVNGREYAVRVRVLVKGDRVTFEADLDGKELIRWEGLQSALDLHIGSRLPGSCRMGLLVISPTVFRSVRLRALGNDAGDAVRPVDTPSPGKMIDVLKLVDLTKHTVAGTWKVGPAGLSGDEVMTPKGYPRIVLPVRAQGSYELVVALRKAKNAILAGVILPVGSDTVSLLLAEGKTVMRYVGTDKGPQSDLTSRVLAKNDSRCVLRVKVLVKDDNAEIIADLGNVSLFRWKGAASSLSLPLVYELPHKQCLGLSVRGPVIFERVTFKLLDGTASILSEGGEADKAE